MKRDTGPRPTVGDLQRTTPWVWLHCEACPHYSPLACAVPVIRWGADASSDVLRQRARLHSVPPEGLASLYLLRHIEKRVGRCAGLSRHKSVIGAEVAYAVCGVCL